MIDIIDLGPVPCDEHCETLGTGYSRDRALAECKRFIDLLRKVFGEEPCGAALVVKSNPHDFGEYLSVVCEFDDRYPLAIRYALECEDKTPRSWDDEEPDQGSDEPERD